MAHSKAMAGSVAVKDASRGLVEAVFSSFAPVIDSDNDVTLPDAFNDGAEVVVSAYQHTSWGGALPVGKGRIRTTPTEAVVDAQFFMQTSHGRDTFETVKSLAESGLGAWSYGFDISDSEAGTFNGQKVRFLKKLKVHEVSPVLLGSGPLTRTLTAKSAAAESPQEQVLREYLKFVKFEMDEAVREELADIYAQWELREEMTRIARNFGVGGWYV